MIVLGKFFRIVFVAFSFQAQIKQKMVKVSRTEYEWSVTSSLYLFHHALFVLIPSNGWKVKVAWRTKNGFRKCNHSRTFSPFQKNTKSPLIYAFAYNSFPTEELFPKGFTRLFSVFLNPWKIRCWLQILKPSFCGFITLLRYWLIFHFFTFRHWISSSWDCWPVSIRSIFLSATEVRKHLRIGDIV